MNRPPKSSAKKSIPGNPKIPSKSLEHGGKVGIRKTDNFRVPTRARGKGSARGK